MNTEGMTQGVLKPAKQYLSLLKERDRAAKELDRVNLDIDRTVNEIGRALAPDDAKNGETFNFWIANPNDIGETLLAVTQVHKVDGCLPIFSIEIRWPRGKGA